MANTFDSRSTSKFAHAVAHSAASWNITKNQYETWLDTWAFGQLGTDVSNLPTAINTAVEGGQIGTDIAACKTSLAGLAAETLAAFVASGTPIPVQDQGTGTTINAEEGLMQYRTRHGYFSILPLDRDDTGSFTHMSGNRITSPAGANPPANHQYYLTEINVNSTIAGYFFFYNEEGTFAFLESDPTTTSGSAGGADSQVTSNPVWTSAPSVDFPPSAGVFPFPAGQSTLRVNLPMPLSGSVNRITYLISSTATSLTRITTVTHPADQIVLTCTMQLVNLSSI